MGCCANGPPKDKDGIQTEIKSIIEKNNPEKIIQLPSLYPALLEKDKINNPFTSYLGISVNVLGYALLKNKFKSFEKLLDIGASIDKLDDLLQKQNKSIMELICFFGLKQFFQFFLPRIDELCKPPSFYLSENTLSLDFDSSRLFLNKDQKTFSVPIQLAVDQGHLQIIDCVYQYQKHAGAVPAAIDIHYVFEKTGENCALVACRKGNFGIVKYLWETAQADFSVKNKNNENALVVTAAGSKHHPDLGHFDVFIYLIEEVKIEYLDSYEEILMLLEDKAIITYYNGLLKKAGIKYKKHDIESKFRPKPAENTGVIDELDSKNFEIQKFIPLREEGSVLSAINSEHRLESFLTNNYCSVFKDSERS